MFNRVAFVSVAAATSVACAQFSPTLQYDAGNGSLPTAQCWDFNGATSPAPQVVNGELLTGPVAVSSTQFYDHELLYDFDRDTVTFEWELHVVSSGYNANSCGVGQRAGWYAAVTDTRGRLVQCGIGSGTVFLTNNGNAYVGVNAPAASFNTTGAYHQYRITITPGSGARLFIDGNQVLSMPIGATGVTASRRASFGDTSVCQTSQTKLRSVLLTLPPQCGFDFNQDCVADFFDYLDFVAAFAANDIRADFNQDGVLDFFDYLDFVSFIAAGC
jgi:hypothetical protein